MTVKQAMLEMIPDTVEYIIDGVEWSIHFNWDRDLYDLERFDEHGRKILLTSFYEDCLTEIAKVYIDNEYEPEEPSISITVVPVISTNCKL